MLFKHSLPPIPLTIKPGTKGAFTWVSGHVINKPQPEARGPRWNVPGMIVGKCLGRDEVRSLRLFTGSSGQRLLGFLQEAGLTEYQNVYVTNLIKTQPLISGKWFQSWVDQQAFLLDMEIALVRPKFVLTLGKEATKHLTKNTQAMSSIEGTWIDCELDLRSDKNEPKTAENTHKYRVIPCTHPASLDYEQRQGVVERIQQVTRQFVGAVQSGNVVTVKSCEYPVIRDVVALENLFDRIRDEHTLKLVAVDAEWQGEHPQNEGAFMRCVQLGWAPGKAAVIAMTDTQGSPAFADADGNKNKRTGQLALEQIQTFFDSGFRVAGHFFPADLEVLSYEGCDLSRAYAAAETPEKARTEGGFALEAAVHAYDELSDMSLDAVMARFTTMPPYKQKLTSYIKEAKKQAGKEKNKELQSHMKRGFGWISDEILYPYAGGDADGTIRSVLRMIALLDEDRFGNNCWLPYWRNHRASLVAAEIMQQGLLVNEERLAQLCVAYKKVYDRMSQALARKIKWPKFSVDNYRHVLEFLYGRRYSAAIDKKSGRRKSIRPCGALTINAEPVLTNEKSPRFWADIRAKGEENIASPGTSGKTIGVLFNDPRGLAVRRFDPDKRKFVVKRIKAPPSLNLIRDLRTIRQVQKTFVGKGVKRELVEQNGILVPKYIFDKGLGPTICGDGKVRCFISQVKETGRWSAKSPNLHALPKRKEERYERICGEDYLAGIRTVFEADEGYLLIESDYSSAELFMLSIASGDEQLWEDCRRSLLPDDHPDFLDPHSNMAVEALKLHCAPTKKGLDSIGKKYMRDVAKCIAEGEFFNTSAGLIRVERFAGDLKPGESKQVKASVACQSDRGKTPLIAIANTGKKRCVRVRTELGYELICTPDHRWYVVSENGDIEFKQPKHFVGSEHAILSPRLINHSAKATVPPAISKALKLFRDADDSNYDSKFPTARESEVLGFICATLGHGNVRFDKQRALVVTRNGHNQQLALELVKRLKLLGVGEDAIAVQTYDGWGVATFGVGFIALCTAAQKVEFIGVPDLAMTWPERERLAFLRGFCSALTTGSESAPTVVIPCPEDARKVQQLLLGSSILCKRESFSDTKSQVLTPVDKTSREFFGSVFLAERSLPNPRTVHVRKLPYIDAGLRRLMASLGMPTGFGANKLFTKRRAILEKLNSLDKVFDALEPPQQRYVQRVKDLISGQMITDKIVSITDAGERITYDVQTTVNRRHLVLFGGICTHNSVVYGWCYGRQPPAIVLGAAEEGVIIQLEEAEAIFNRLAQRYNRGQSYLRSAAERVQVGCLCTPLGRWRRFPESTDRRTIAGYQREAMNSPIQGGVADLVNDAAYNLYAIRQEMGMTFRIALQVHDAFLFLVPYREVVQMCNYVIPEAMVNRAGVVPFRLDGSMTQNSPMRLGFGLNIYKRWGESLTPAQIAEYGIDSSKIKRLE